MTHALEGVYISPYIYLHVLLHAPDFLQAMYIASQIVTPAVSCSLHGLTSLLFSV
jgi:hypothetical protein